MDGLSMTLGFVVIGRNEAAHLADCIGALPRDLPIIYADSASTDGSLDVARAAGADIVALTTPPMLTASRGRNAGLARLLQVAPGTALVHMVDGDVVLDRAWVAAATAAMAGHPRTGAVFGQLRERHPDASIYNRMCDREWRVPAGKVMACGGIALFRVEAIQQAGGYDNAIAAGEEPDLCLRMRTLGWDIMCLPDAMGVHDAGLLHFGQWWRRARRGGQAFAEHVVRHRSRSDPNSVRQVLSIGFWGGAVPLCAILLAFVAPVFALIPIALWLVMVVRVTVNDRSHFASFGDALQNGVLTMVGKFAQLLGMFDFSSRSAIQKMRGPSIK
jgi:GT2 family glycosyltransferase